MVKCSRCGVDVEDSFEMCPNCGNSLLNSQDESVEDLTCSNCGAPIDENVEFCSACGTKVKPEINSSICETCGSEVPEGVVFCPTCGNKVKPPEIQKQVTVCRNCGFMIEEEVTFCPECGTNIMTGEKQVTQTSNQSFADKINLDKIIKPTVISLVAAVVLSVIGVLIGLSWISFIIAIILSVGFFAGLIDNEANATVSGFFVGLILGILENPIIEFCWGSLAAGFYEWFYGSQLFLLIVLGIITAYISNIYLKKNIREIAGSFASRL